MDVPFRDCFRHVEMDVVFLLYGVFGAIHINHADVFFLRDSYDPQYSLYALWDPADFLADGQPAAWVTMYATE